MSKVVEREAASQLNMYLSVNGLLPRYQSAYRQKHSTETALLRVWSDILMSADVREVTLLGLLDLSAAFDCVDHVILLQKLEVVFGLTNTALRWIRSFYRPNAAGFISWMPVTDPAVTVWRAAGVSARPTPVCSLHC